jgi:hypothetical protein
VLPVLPWPRALGSAVVITTLGLAAHVSVADHAVSPLLVVGFLVVATLLVRMLQGGPGSRVRLAALLAAGQMLFHILLSPGHSGGHAHTVVAAHGHDSTAGLRRSVAPMAPVIMEWLGAGVSSLVTQPAMLLAHAGAAVAAGWWLAHGERLAATSIAAITALFRVAPTVAADPARHTRPRLVPVQSRGLRSQSRLLGRSLARRGPPVQIRGLFALPA